MKATQEKYSNMSHPAPPRKTADLSTDIAEAVATVFGTRIDTIFSADPSERRPHLQKPGRNRIMIYPGCFNPPHRGHAAILNAAYEASHDLNVIAASLRTASRQEGQCRRKRHGAHQGRKGQAVARRPQIAALAMGLPVPRYDDGMVHFPRPSRCCHGGRRLRCHVRDLVGI